jgi:hypothetical protein
LASALFAYREGTARVPNTPPRRELMHRVGADADALHVYSRLDAYRTALRVLERERDPQQRYFLLRLRPTDRVLEIDGFREGEIERATQDYLLLERDLTRPRDTDVVLVRAESLEALRRAYPNYFLDTAFFLHTIQELIRPSAWAVRK